MTYLLDTNTCIKFLNGQSDSIRHRIESLNPDDLVLCAVVKAELLYGAAKSSRPAENLSKLHHFFARFVSLPFDDSAAVAYGVIRARLEKAGLPIGPNDMLIAAIAVSGDRILVTHNRREFGRVEDLRFEDWE